MRSWLIADHTPEDLRGRVHIVLVCSRDVTQSRTGRQCSVGRRVTKKGKLLMRVWLDPGTEGVHTAEQKGMV